MKRTVIWSRRAGRDVIEQASFIAEKNQTSGLRVISEIQKAATALGRFSTGRPARKLGFFEKSVPKLPYIIAYAIRPNNGGEAIVILRVIHTSRDWPADSWPE